MPCSPSQRRWTRSGLWRMTSLEASSCRQGHGDGRHNVVGDKQRASDTLARTLTQGGECANTR
jgi:hypothetical protein